MEAKTIFIICWFIATAFILTFFYIKGKKALAIFPEISKNKIKFRDKSASGYSSKSLHTKFGGARNALDVIVTEDELWLKSMLLFAFICKLNDLLHRIPLQNITSVEENGKKITIDFTSELGESKQVVITTDNPKELIHTLSVSPLVNIEQVKATENIASGTSKKRKFILITSLVFICGLIVFYQYKSQKAKHERLISFGQIVPITSRLSKSSDADYARYYFITEQGEKIEGNEKCGNEYQKYVTALAIYNPKDPSEYELSFDFETYYPTWRIIFFFFIYLPAMEFVTYGFINVGVTIYSKLKR